MKKTYETTVRINDDGERERVSFRDADEKEGVVFGVSLTHAAQAGKSGFRPGQRVKVTLETVD